MKYFEIRADDKHFGDRWFLGEPVSESGQSIDARLFRYGKTYEGIAPHWIPVRQSGKRTVFSLAAFDMPVVSIGLYAILRSAAANECEFFPVTVGASNHGMSIVNVIGRAECVDEMKCEDMRKWRPEDIRPDRLGAYRSIGGLRVDPAKVAGHHMFRVFGWEVSLVVSDMIRTT